MPLSALTWPVAAGILAVFTGLGALIDRFMVARQKSALHLALMRFWVRLDDTRVADLDGTVCAKLDRVGSSLRRHHVATLLGSLALSWLLTTAAWFFGVSADGEDLHLRSVKFDDLPYVTEYAANFMCDALTVLSFSWMISRASRGHRAIGHVANIAAGVGVAVLCAWLSLALHDWADDLAAALRLPMSQGIYIAVQSNFWTSQRRNREQIQPAGRGRRGAAAIIRSTAQRGLGDRKNHPDGADIHH